MQIFIRRTIFQLYRGIRPCYFWWNDDNVCFVLTELDFYSPISLKQNKSPQIDMSLHSYKLSCHPLPLFLHATRTNYPVTPCHYFSMPLVQIMLSPLAIISLCHLYKLSCHPLPLFLYATHTNYPDTPCHYFSMPLVQIILTPLAIISPCSGLIAEKQIVILKSLVWPESELN
jgi:hypothetical protein